MASALSRLGRWVATHHWFTIVAWLIVLAITATGALTLSKPFTSEFSIPGSQFEQVMDDVQAELPSAAGASGTAVLSSDDGFTESQREEVRDLFDQWEQVEGVDSVTDPFAAQEELDSSREQVTNGQQELESGREQLNDSEAELEAGQEELDAAREQLEQSQAELDEQREQFEASADQLPEQQRAATEAELDAAQDEIDAGREELNAQQEELEQGRQELEQGRQELQANQEQLEAGQEVTSLSEGYRFVSEDGTTIRASISFDSDSSMIDPAVASEVIDIGDAALADSPVSIDYDQAMAQDFSSIAGASEIVGLVVAAIVLIVMLGTLLAAGLPLLMALMGVGVGLAGAVTMTAVVEMNDVTPVLALMLGLAVGIDYSLFILNRHRTQLRQGWDVTDSIALATGTAGNAVTFAALTVIIALSALTLTGIPFLGTMGLVAAATVAVAGLVAVTLTPAMLSLMGQRVLPRKSRHQPASSKHKANRWAAGVQSHPWLAIIAVVLTLGITAVPTTDIRLGLPDGGSEAEDSTAYAAYDQVREAFGAGANGPILSLAQLDEPLAEGETALLQKQAEIGNEFISVDGIETVVPAGVNDARDALVFQLIPEGGPASAVTSNAVESLQANADSIQDNTGAEVGFTGQTVANIDVSSQLADALPLYLSVVIGLSLILLLLVFRSIVVPFLATAGFLLSVGAAFGAVVAIYQWGWLSEIFGVHETGPILSFLPVLLIGILFGLAMDYQVFLVTGMREAHVHGEDARQAVLTGFSQSARVVTAAAIIMISVFGGFIFAHMTMIRPIGLGLALGVLADAFLVRMTLTPAIMSLLGEKAWYLPKWLDRILPNVDVEGSSLERHSTAEEPTDSARAEAHR